MINGFPKFFFSGFISQLRANRAIIEKRRPVVALVSVFFFLVLCPLLPGYVASAKVACAIFNAGSSLCTSPAMLSRWRIACDLCVLWIFAFSEVLIYWRRSKA